MCVLERFPRWLRAALPRLYLTRFPLLFGALTDRHRPGGACGNSDDAREHVRADPVRHRRRDALRGGVRIHRDGHAPHRPRARRGAIRGRLARCRLGRAQARPGHPRARGRCRL